MCGGSELSCHGGFKCGREGGKGEAWKGVPKGSLSTKRIIVSLMRRAREQMDERSALSCPREEEEEEEEEEELYNNSDSNNNNNSFSLSYYAVW